MPPPECIEELALLAQREQELTDANTYLDQANVQLLAKEDALNAARSEYDIAYNLRMQAVSERDVAQANRDQAAADLETCQSMQMSAPPSAPEVS